MVEHAKALASAGAEIYCWSTTGADYARGSTQGSVSINVLLGFFQIPMLSLTTNNSVRASYLPLCIPRTLRGSHWTTIGRSSSERPTRVRAGQVGRNESISTDDDPQSCMRSENRVSQPSRPGSR